MGKNSGSGFLARRSSLLEDVMELPWPIGAVMALLCYPVALIISGYLASQPSTILQPLSSVPLTLWPLFSLMFGFASLISFIIGLKEEKPLQAKPIYPTNTQSELA